MEGEQGLDPSPPRPARAPCTPAGVRAGKAAAERHADAARSRCSPKTRCTGASSWLHAAHPKGASPRLGGSGPSRSRQAAGDVQGGKPRDCDARLHASSSAKLAPAPRKRRSPPCRRDSFRPRSDSDGRAERGNAVTDNPAMLSRAGAGPPHGVQPAGCPDHPSETAACPKTGAASNLPTNPIPSLAATSPPLPPPAPLPGLRNDPEINTAQLPLSVSISHLRQLASVPTLSELTGFSSRIDRIFPTETRLPPHPRNRRPRHASAGRSRLRACGVVEGGGRGRSVLLRACRNRCVLGVGVEGVVGPPPATAPLNLRSLLFTCDRTSPTPPAIAPHHFSTLLST